MCGVYRYAWGGWLGGWLSGWGGSPPTAHRPPPLTAHRPPPTAHHPPTTPPPTTIHHPLTHPPPPTLHRPPPTHPPTAHPSQKLKPDSPPLDAGRVVRFGVTGLGSGLLWTQWYGGAEALLAPLPPTGRLVASLVLEQFVWCPILYAMYIIPLSTMLNGAFVWCPILSYPILSYMHGVHYIHYTTLLYLQCSTALVCTMPYRATP